MRGGGRFAGSQPMRTAVHITWHGAQINFGDLKPSYGCSTIISGRGRSQVPLPRTTWALRNRPPPPPRCSVRCHRPPPRGTTTPPPPLCHHDDPEWTLTTATACSGMEDWEGYENYCNVTSKSFDKNEYICSSRSNRNLSPADFFILILLPCISCTPYYMHEYRDSFLFI
jgi:hypothetical protein